MCIRDSDSDDSNLLDVAENNRSVNSESAHHYRSAVQSSVTCDDDVEMNDVEIRNDDDEEHDVVRKQFVTHSVCDMQNVTCTTGSDICRQNSVKNAENERYCVSAENKTDRQTIFHGKNVSSGINVKSAANYNMYTDCLLYTSPSPRD